MLTKNELIVLYGMRTMDYEKDPNPEHWRTISGAKVHLDNNGEIDGGAGGNFNGNYWDGKKGQQHVIGPHTMMKKNIGSGATNVMLAAGGFLGNALGKTGTTGGTGGSSAQTGTQTKEQPPNNQHTGAGKRDYGCRLATKLGNNHYDNMREKVESCGNESFKSFWGATESRVSVGDANHKGRAYAWFNSIYVDVERNAKGSMFKAPYQTVFHECGHVIDNASSETGGNYLSVEYKGGIFAKTIKEEIMEPIEKLAADMKKAYKEHGSDYEWLFQNGYINKYERDHLNHLETHGHNMKYYLPLKFYKSMAYNKFYEDNIQKLDLLASCDIEDIIEGVTRGKIGSGHGKTYWSKWKYLGQDAPLAMETFAEMTSAIATNPQSLETIKKFLPKSFKIYQEMMEVAKQRSLDAKEKAKGGQKNA